MLRGSRPSPAEARPVRAQAAQAAQPQTGDANGGCGLAAIHVERCNPALRLSEWLWFRLVEDRGVSVP